MEAEDIGVEDDEDWVEMWLALERHLEKSKPAQGLGDLRVRLHDSVKCFRVIARDLQYEFDRSPDPRKVIRSVAQHLDDLGVVMEALEKRLETTHVAQ